MTYPTPAQVESADRRQLGVWWRFLPSPGVQYIGTDLFEDKLAEQTPIMERIGERFKEMGMFTPDISKSVGWKPSP